VRERTVSVERRWIVGFSGRASADGPRRAAWPTRAWLLFSRAAVLQNCRLRAGRRCAGCEPAFTAIDPSSRPTDVCSMPCQRRTDSWPARRRVERERPGARLSGEGEAELERAAGQVARRAELDDHRLGLALGGGGGGAGMRTSDRGCPGATGSSRCTIVVHPGLPHGLRQPMRPRKGSRELPRHASRCTWSLWTPHGDRAWLLPGSRELFRDRIASGVALAVATASGCRPARGSPSARARRASACAA
jgi:hypothetical protein